MTFITVALGLASLAGVGRAAPPPPPPPVVMPAPSLWGEHFQVDLTLLDIGGAPLVHRQFDTALGQTQTVSANHQGRTSTVDATFSAGDRVGCVATKLVVVDRRIDTTGQFARTDWSSTVQSCDRGPLTVGHADQVRVRFSMKPAGEKPGAARPPR
jgi:hypothetical protein